MYSKRRFGENPWIREMAGVHFVHRSKTLWPQKGAFSILAILILIVSSGFITSDAAKKLSKDKLDAT